MSSREFFVKITEKWPVKILSLGAALLISFFYKMSTMETRSFSQHILFESANSLVPASYDPQEVNIKIRVEKDSVYQKLEEDIEAYIDLSKYTSENTYKIPVQIRKKGIALGIEPLEITVNPTDISVRLENKISREIKITPSFQGYIAEGYEMSDPIYTPTSANVEGPRSNVQALHELTTEAIDLNGRYKDFSITLNIINNDPLIVIYGSKTIEYRAAIKQIMREPPSPAPALIIDEADEQ